MNPSVSGVRMAVIQLLILSLLATLVGRLWYLQVLAGSEAKAIAERTSIRFVYEQAPRGFIFDRDGRTLARNRTSLTVAVDVSRIPSDRKDQVVSDLARVLEMPVAKVRDIVDDKRIGPHTPRPVALDVDKNVVIYLSEHADRFPGVTHLEIPVREYPMGTLASHVVGHIGEIDEKELEASRHRHRPVDGIAPHTYRPGDLIGKLGVEKVYEDWLAGRPGVRRIAVNVRGEPVEETQATTPQRGWDAILTIDASLQQAAETALKDGIDLARTLTDPDSKKKFVAPAGAVVALDPTDGDVLALASNPDFDPNMFVGSASPSELARLTSPQSHMPFLNRAIAEAVPPGSTFKPITAAAAWSVDPTLPARSFDCPPYIKIGNQIFHDWKLTGQGTLGLAASLAQSCDITFYRLGVELNARKSQIGEHLQDVARQFGLGRPTGIDLLGELEGLVPDEAWKWQHFNYAQTYDRRWFPGDSANLAIGQGFLQVTPLQLADAYAAIANGGTVWRPHVLKCMAQLNVSRPVGVDEACASGRVPPSAVPRAEGHVSVPPEAFRYIETALEGTVRGDGTAAAAFQGFPLDRIEVAGKTGTAQMAPKQPFSWFAAIGKQGARQIVVVALVEEAGTGAQIAAPIVRKVLERYFNVPAPSGIQVGVSAD